MPPIGTEVYDQPSLPVHSTLHHSLLFFMCLFFMCLSCFPHPHRVAPAAVSLNAFACPTVGTLLLRVGCDVAALGVDAVAQFGGGVRRYCREPTEQCLSRLHPGWHGGRVGGGAQAEAGRQAHSSSSGGGQGTRSGCGASWSRLEATTETEATGIPCCCCCCFCFFLCCLLGGHHWRLGGRRAVGGEGHTHRKHR